MPSAIKRNVNRSFRSGRHAVLLAAAAALLLQVAAWAHFAPAMALGRIAVFCNVAEHQEHPPARGTVKTDHCALCLLAQGLTPPPGPPMAPAPASPPDALAATVRPEADYVGWFLSTLQARAPPPPDTPPATPT